MKKNFKQIVFILILVFIFLIINSNVFALERNDNTKEGLAWIKISKKRLKDIERIRKPDLRMHVISSKGTEIDVQHFNNLKRKDIKNGINVNRTLFDWRKSEIGNFVIVKWFEKNKGKKEDKTFSVNVFPGVKVNFNLIKGKNDKELGTKIIYFDHNIDEYYDTGLIEFKMSRYYFAINGKQSITQTHSYNSTLKLKGSNSGEKKFFVSVIKSDKNWGLFGTEAMGWLNPSQNEQIVKGTFNIKDFAAKKGVHIKPNTYYRITLVADAPTWYSKTYLVYIKS